MSHLFHIQTTSALRIRPLYFLHTLLCCRFSFKLIKLIFCSSIYTTQNMKTCFKNQKLKSLVLFLSLSEATVYIDSLCKM